MTQGKKINKKAKGVLKVNKEGKTPIRKNGVKCLFCKKVGHVKKDCPKYKRWFKKKGKFNFFVCYESFFVDVLHNTWWLDSGSISHISTTI